ncbi:MlaD family protein [Nocardia amamiensis]|uniref:MlaD family protein n=1 Tax=Nocardia TaxID=1817 RepID=UPI0033DD8CE6
MRSAQRQLRWGSWSLLPDAASHALRDTTHITADFDNIAGIHEGNPVTVLGLEVGKVEKITPKGALIEVRLSIEPEVKIRKRQ